MRVLTGIQPTNVLHIGNLFGALIPALELQKENDLYMMIADYHAITVPHEAHALNESILTVAAAYLAVGIDPTKTVLFQQSQISAHTELAWILETIAYMGEAKRMTQFKDKSGDKQDNVSVGLFAYPILMAADILLYDAKNVPVGHDQKQHLELARDLAQRFNSSHGQTFVVPDPLICKHGARLKSLTEPDKKMSKSAASAKSYISLMDDPDLIHKKIRSAVTDSQQLITFDESREGLYNLLTIFSLATGRPADEIANEYIEKGMKELKDNLSEVLCSYLLPIQTKMKKLLGDKQELTRIINNGSASAKKVADAKLKEVKKKIGVIL
ncbi:TPA: tryptophan--tRNA ligase [Candidatus Uhrbacteria bacterium]|nr:MAG: tryptophan--tRNA ligase [Candidatus Uhrbacteria bacterium RIFOXYB2_FULL_41_10]HAL49927.1 tryptophan--tRNA ligase [Candidatus Uhrbacteria bacterium]HAN06167.1 tryptophan--tRNA ligase [Candidatus Uhrbacteria bacterium]HAP65482.1 tryptophan--tRNA ligase [Candidatus Uhrbacteria bacterium]HBA51390.1 tryptophan--tRNA ligase [Candidatus Uhrbacteria bacterium]